MIVVCILIPSLNPCKSGFGRVIRLKVSAVPGLSISTVVVATATTSTAAIAFVQSVPDNHLNWVFGYLMIWII